VRVGYAEPEEHMQMKRKCLARVYGFLFKNRGTFHRFFRLALSRRLQELHMKRGNALKSKAAAVVAALLVGLFGTGRMATAQAQSAESATSTPAVIAEGLIAEIRLLRKGHVGDTLTLESAGKNARGSALRLAISAASQPKRRNTFPAPFGENILSSRCSRAIRC
jgi:hypothetical protein